MIVIATIIFINQYTRNKSLKNAFIIGTGTVFSIRSPPESGTYLNYSYIIEGKTYEDFIYLPDFISFSDAKVLIGKNFPVIYAKKNFNNSRLLLDSASFAYYGLQYPDSLRWLTKYFRK